VRGEARQRVEQAKRILDDPSSSSNARDSAIRSVTATELNDCHKERAGQYDWIKDGGRR
jgi:hypothetical protein